MIVTNQMSKIQLLTNEFNSFFIETKENKQADLTANHIEQNCYIVMSVIYYPYFHQQHILCLYDTKAFAIQKQHNIEMSSKYNVQEVIFKIMHCITKNLVYQSNSQLPQNYHLSLNSLINIKIDKKFVEGYRSIVQILFIFIFSTIKHINLMIARTLIYFGSPFLMTLRYFHGVDHSNAPSTKALQTTIQNEILKARTIKKIVNLIAASDDCNIKADQKEWLKKYSLADKILKLIDQVPPQHQGQIISFFKGGVEYDKFVFHQRRILDGQTNEKLIFCPTTLVTSKIFNLIINGVYSSNRLVIFSGLFGTSKTFSFLLYCKLAAIVNRVALSGVSSEIRKEILIPKMVYLNMDPQHFVQWTDLPQEEKNQQIIKLLFYKKAWEYFDEMILRQCQQLKEIKLILSDKKLKQIQKDPTLELKLKIKEYGKFYLSQGIKTILLVDQINKIASQIRKNPKGQYKGSDNQQMKLYLASMALNGVRASIMNQFDRKIFNSSSSLTVETYDDNLLEKLKTFPQLQHAGRGDFVELPYMNSFRPEYRKLTYCQLTDILFFQIENHLGELNYDKLVQSSLKAKEVEGLTSKEIIRNQGCEIIQKLSGDLHLTPLFIRQGVNEYIKKKPGLKLTAENYKKELEQILKQCAKKSTDNFIKSIDHFLNKTNNEKIKKAKKSLFKVMYKAAIQQIQQSNDNEYLQLNITKQLEGLTKQQTKMELFDRSLFELKGQQTFISLLPSKALVSILDKKFSQKQLDTLDQKNSPAKSHIAEGTELQCQFFNELRQSTQATIKSNSKFIFKLNKQFFLMKPFPKVGDKTEVPRQPEYFLQLIKAAENSFDKIKKFSNQDQLFVAPGKKQDVQYSFFEPLEQKQQLQKKLNARSKFVDFAIFQRKIIQQSNGEFYHLHFFDFTVSKDCLTKIKKLKEFYTYHNMHEHLSRIKLSETITSNKKYCKVFLHYNVVALSSQQYTFEVQKAGDFSLLLRVIPLQEFKLITKSKHNPEKINDKFNEYVKQILKNNLEKILLLQKLSNEKLKSAWNGTNQQNDDKK